MALLHCPVFFGLEIYVTFSWKSWYYGRSFGARALIETFTLLSFPLAAFIAGCRQTKRGKYIITTLLSAFIALNMFQSYQYSTGVIHYEEMTRKYYWRVFGKMAVTEEDRRLLQEK